MSRTIRLAALLALAAPGVAHAHAGHVAEVAGHAHWIALGAVAAAAAIAAALAGAKAREDAAEADEGEAADGEAA